MNTANCAIGSQGLNRQIGQPQHVESDTEEDIAERQPKKRQRKRIIMLKKIVRSS